MSERIRLFLISDGALNVDDYVRNLTTTRNETSIPSHNHDCLLEDKAYNGTSRRLREHSISEICNFLSM